MAMRISNAAAKAACDAVVDLLDAGSTAGYIEVRSGEQPAGPGTAATGTLLGTLLLTTTAFGAAADAAPGGEATANSIADDTSADADGTATWFRAYDSDDNAVIDGSLTATGGGGDIELSSVAISSGGTISIDSWKVKMPEA